MATYTHRREHSLDGHTPQASQPHIAYGAHQVSLLHQHHPPLKFARLHHADIPNHDNPGYTDYRAARDGALANAVREFELELGARSAVDHICLENEKLIVRHCSQSKLSQQELADLQKATHFDKKELQQWYKGAPVTPEHMRVDF